MKRARLVWVLLVLAAFAAGVWCDRTCLKSPRGGWGRQDHERIMNEFSRKLNLTPQQQQRVGAILEERRRQMRALHYQVRPQFESMRAKTREQIRAVLTPEQAKRFDELEAKMDKRWQRVRDQYDNATQAKSP